MLKNVVSLLIAAFGVILFIFAPGEYWWLVGASIFVVAWLLLLLVIIPFMKVPRRGQLASLAVSALIAGLVAMALMGYVQSNDLTTQLEIEAWGALAFIGSRLWSATLGAIVAIVVSSIFLFFVGYFSSIYIVGLHEEEVGFWNAFKSFVFLVLDVNLAWLLVENGEIIELKKQGFVNKWLSRGKIIIKPGNAIVTEKGGAITDIRGPGVKLTVKDERIREVFDLRPQVAIKTVENVLTADQIPLEIELGIGYKITPFEKDKSEMKAQNGEAVNTNGYLKVFQEKNYNIFPVAEDTLKRAAFNGTAGGWRGFGDNAPIGQLRDQIMAHEFSELFRVTVNEDDLKIRANQRQVKRIEDVILETLNGFADGTIGLTYTFIDIREIHFPAKIADKITAEVAVFFEERIKKTEARIKELDAQTRARITKLEADTKNEVRVTDAESKHTIAEYEAKVILEIARAKAHSEVLKGKGKAEAKAEYYRQVLQTLQAYGQSAPETVNTVLKSLSVTALSEEEFRQLLFGRYEFGTRRARADVPWPVNEGESEIETN